MNRLLRVLPAVALALVGAWLWQGGADVVATERTFDIVPKAPLSTVASVEAQVWSEGALLRRVSWNTPSGVLEALSIPVPLHRGPVEVRLGVERKNGGTFFTVVPVAVSEATHYVVRE